MELKQLQFFVVSVDMGSFKKAAEVLYTTQPHISKTIKALERELQVDLLNRKTSGVTMTEAGQQVYTYASSILQQADVIEKVSEKKTGKNLRIASVPNCNIALIFAKFCQLKKEEEIQYVYQEGKVEDIMGYLHHRVADVGFVFISQRQFSGFHHQLEHKRLEFSLLQKTDPCLYVGKNSPLFGLSSVDSSVLGAVRLVQPPEDFYSISIHPGHLKEDFPIHHGDQIAVLTNSDNVTRYLLEYSEMGNVSTGLAGSMGEKGMTRAIPLTDIKENISFGYIQRTQDELPPLTQEFIRFVKSELD